MTAYNAIQFFPGPILVVLAHGTWPYGFLRSVLVHVSFLNVSKPPIWNRCPGPFQDALQAEFAKLRILPEPRIVPFTWSGYNTILARRNAARELADLLDKEQKSGPCRIFVVAHSHGGNVAEYASSISAAPVAGLVTLATPFISASPRKFTDSDVLLLRSAFFGAGVFLSFYGLSPLFFRFAIGPLERHFGLVDQQGQPLPGLPIPEDPIVLANTLVSLLAPLVICYYVGRYLANTPFFRRIKALHGIEWVILRVFRASGACR